MLTDEYRNLGDDFRKNVSSFTAITVSTAKPAVLRHSTAFGRISQIFFMKVDMGLEVDSRPALLVFSVLQTTSEIPTHANPLFLWTRTQKLWHSMQHGLENSAQEQTPTAHWGWNSDVVNVHVDAVEKHLKLKLGHQRILWTRAMIR